MPKTIIQTHIRNKHILTKLNINLKINIYLKQLSLESKEKSIIQYISEPIQY